MVICVYVVVATESSSAFYAMESDSCFCEQTYVVIENLKLGYKGREGRKEGRKEGGKMIEG